MKAQMYLETMPHVNQSLERIEAWYNQEIIDRVPIRFYTPDPVLPVKTYETIKERWFDVEYQIENVRTQIERKEVIAESFPIYWPNLGPGVYAAYYDTELIFTDYTSYTVPKIKNPREAKGLKLNKENEYFKQIDRMTAYALERLKGKAFIGHTDLHPGMDCVADWLDPQELCVQLIDDPKGVKIALEKSVEDFGMIYNYYDELLKSHGQPSFGWLGIPTLGKAHTPSCDFSTMVSKEDFREFCLPAAMEEMGYTTHNVWHLDGQGCARHLDDLLELKELQAIQWEPGAGNGKPIMQWLPLIKKIQNAGKSVMVTLNSDELEPFMNEISPQGLYLCINAPSNEDAKNMVKAIEKWR